MFSDLDLARARAQSRRALDASVLVGRSSGGEPERLHPRPWTHPLPTEVRIGSAQSPEPSHPRRCGQAFPQATNGPCGVRHSPEAGVGSSNLPRRTECLCRSGAVSRTLMRGLRSPISGSWSAYGQRVVSGRGRPVWNVDGRRRAGPNEWLRHRQPAAVPGRTEGLLAKAVLRELPPLPQRQLRACPALVPSARAFP